MPADPFRLAVGTLRRELRRALALCPRADRSSSWRGADSPSPCEGRQYATYIATLPLVLALNAAVGHPEQPRPRLSFVAPYLEQLYELLTATAALGDRGRAHLRSVLPNLLQRYHARLSPVSGSRG